ncbi:MAG TPA: ChbG/HpnK family deacetylase [Gammaproteobacteria bacterium]|nr:ChbG/HpnK family deacetylase [Gammaproteobacteria bacterium]
MGSREKYLIVNADDFGYFHCVSRGILELASLGVVTATGIMANGTDFRTARETTTGGSLDYGVHLNLTYGVPLTAEMARAVAGWGGRFPSKSRMALAILSGRIGLSDVEREWRAQIQCCLDEGVPLRFLNSHEHIHMLPPLYRLAKRLAREFSIDHVRHTQPEWGFPLGVAAMVRNAVMQSCNILNPRFRGERTPRLVGLNRSGKLDIEYLDRLFSGFSSGKIYELMCHPGHLDSAEIRDPRLLAYHRWEQEFELLSSSSFLELCQKYHVHLVGYGNLPKG